MSDQKPTTGRGVYTATPISVTFPADCKNTEYAGKTVTYPGRGRKPRWWDYAVELGLITEKAKSEPSDAQEPKAATAAG